MPQALPLPTRDVVVVHSSICTWTTTIPRACMAATARRGLKGVRCARRREELRADVVVLAGDTFDCHRLPERAAGSGGRGDRGGGPAGGAAARAFTTRRLPDAVFRDAARWPRVDNLHVLGVTARRRRWRSSPDLDLESLGAAAPGLRRHDPVRDDARPRRNALAGRDGARALRAGARPNDPAAPVLADRGRRARRHRRRLRRARALELGCQGGWGHRRFIRARRNMPARSMW